MLIFFLGASLTTQSFITHPVLHYPPRPSLFSHPFITHSAVYYSPSPPYFTQPFIIHQGLHCFSSLSLFSSPSLPSQAFIIFLALYYSPRLSLPNHRALHSAPAFHYITPPSPTPTATLPTQPLPGKVVHSTRDYYRAIIFLFIFLSPFFIAGCVFYRYLSIHCVDHFLWSWYQFTRSCWWYQTHVYTTGNLNPVILDTSSQLTAVPCPSYRTLPFLI